MAYKISFGDGSLGDVSTISTTVNSSARITALNDTSITINNSAQTTGMATFATGAKILIHVSAAVTSTYKTYLGRYAVATITAVNSNVFTVDIKPTDVIPSAQLGNYYVQAVAIAQFKNLTLSTGTAISPVTYSTTNYHGGIVAIMCSDTLTFDGGHISLTDRGIPVGSKALRPTLNYIDVASDYTTNAGTENALTKDYFLLNAGDGAVFIAAKTLKGNSNSRIGNTSTFGVQFYRGNADSVTYNTTAPTGVTNVGGSTILIAAESIENFDPKMIAKYRSSSATAGQGICRCYIASNTKLRNDEGLYAYDCLHDANRIKELGIKSFGNGSFGDVTNNTSQMNNYATVTAISGSKLTFKNATTVGLAQFTTGSMVMVHFNHKNSTKVENSGRFILATILANNGSVMTLDTAPPSISPTDYACQVISIPQCDNFTLTGTNSATPKFNGAQGGIFAISVKNSCNIAGGKINVEQKGGGTAYGRNGLAYIGNAQNSNKLPIGAGHGSVFILANSITMNTSTRIGATYSGAEFGGHGTATSKTSVNDTVARGGFRGLAGNAGVKHKVGWGYSGGGAGAYNGGGGNGQGKTASPGPVGVAGGTGGSGAFGGGYNQNGGFGSNGTRTGATVETVHEGWQGAHVFIVADEIKGFNLYAISTGGNRGVYVTDKAGKSYGTHGGAGYGGGAPCTGANQGTGGGGSGWAFIYCNKAADPNTTGYFYTN